jgi:hypothetical protein
MTIPPDRIDSKGERGALFARGSPGWSRLEDYFLP